MSAAGGCSWQKGAQNQLRRLHGDGLPTQDPQAELLSLDVLPPSMRDIRIPPPESGLESDS